MLNNYIELKISKRKMEKLNINFNFGFKDIQTKFISKSYKRFNRKF